MCPSQDPVGVTVTTQITLEKFDGEGGPVVERIVIEDDGSISEHWKEDNGTD